MPHEVSLALVLHAHLPWLRDDEAPSSLEERWFFEALVETYVPLLSLVERLVAGGRAPTLALSISPTLAAMLADPVLMGRAASHLEATQRFAERSLARAHDEPRERAFVPALAAEVARLERVAARLGGLVPMAPGGPAPLARALAVHAPAGLELFTTALTHAFLPLLEPSLARAQVRLGRALAAHLGVPRGPSLWLPECAYVPELDALLASEGVALTFLDAHGLTLASPAPPARTLGPVVSRAGVAYLGRDHASAREVWSRKHGFPGHPDYREYHLDWAHVVPDERVPARGPRGERLASGVKPFAVTGAPEKRPYEPERGRALAREHARVFLESVVARASLVPRALLLGAPPLVVAPFDAELMGHFWLEGPSFVESLFELAPAHGVALVTPSAALRACPVAFAAEPATSTWGEGGFAEVWAGERARPWLVALHRATRLVFGRGAGLPPRARRHALRELSLLAASDLPFALHRGVFEPWAEGRITRAQERLSRLVAGDRGLVAELEREPFLAELDDDEVLASTQPG